MEADEEKAALDLSPFSSSVILNEEVFISQLHRRAQLLNTAFQQAVLDVLKKHSKGGANNFVSARKLSSESFCSITSDEQDWIKYESSVRKCCVECLFKNGECSAVYFHSAPVKTLARMKEKLAE